MKLKLIIFLLILGTIQQSQAQKMVAGSRGVITSPGKLLTTEFYQKEVAGKRTMYYTIKFKGQDIILESVLDLQLDNSLSEKAMAIKVDQHARWCENLVVKKILTAQKDTSWSPLYGERKNILDRYNTLTVELVKDDNPIYNINVEIRAYDAGIALRYFFPENSKGTYYNVTAENTEFQLPAGTTAWFANWAQAPYQHLPLDDWPGESERPLTLQLPNGFFACLAEAQMTDYARTKYKLSKERANTIQTSMAGEAALISPVATPWRVIMVAERAGDLIEHNDIILSLNERSKIANTDWIKPGKIIRVMTQTTADARANIDFAVQQGLQYILFDWKWYGPAFSFSSDATKVAIPDFDLPDIISYGKKRGVGVWLYVNQQALLAQSDSLFAHYKKWGVKGVKFGFVQVGSHRWTTWVEKTIEQAADNQIMVNIHDDWRPTGEQRTWPNLMTAEGIRGNEEMPDATHNTILPFTRYIAGAADYTICYFDKRIKTTHAHQLALAAIYYSPIQTLFWYDKPSMYHNEPELAFWKTIPTTWDETRVIDGKPGEYISTARRSGFDWYVGTISNKIGRTVTLDLSFLTSGKKYVATIYSDDPKIKTNTQVRVSKQYVDAKSRLKIELLPSGGQAMMLSPVK